MARTITDNDYKELISAGGAVVIDFWAEWCGPCRRVAPIIDELSVEFEGKAVIGKCDVDNNNEIATEFGIMSIPTILYFKGGQMVDKVVGAADKGTLKAKIEAIL